MSDAAVEATLRVMHREGDPRLKQYVVALHAPDGWTLQRIGDVCGVSRERVRQWEVQGLNQIDREGRMDLSGLPMYTRRKRATAAHAAVAMPEQTREVLRTLNEEAQRFSGTGSDPRPVEAFNKMVVQLMDAGIPMNVIARACGQREDSFRKRMDRWGIRSPHRRPDPVPVESKTPEPTRVKASMCRWPDCPSRTGEGACIH